MYNERCTQCGTILNADEVGLYKKLVNRGATTYCCLDCLGAHFRLTVEELLGLIERFRAQGCSLFVKEKR